MNDATNGLTTTWTGRNGTVMTVPAGRTCKQQASLAMRGQLETPGYNTNLDPQSGLLVAIVRRAGNGHTLAPVAAWGFMLQSQTTAHKISTTITDNNNPGILHETNANVSAPYTADAAGGERTVTSFIFRKAGAGGICQINMERAGQSASYGGTALPTGEAWKMMLGTGDYAGISYSDPDIEAVHVFRIPVATSGEANYRAALRYVVAWCETDYPLANRAKKRIMLVGDSHGAGQGSTGNVQGALYKWLNGGGRNATWEGVNLSIGGYEMGIRKSLGGDQLTQQAASIELAWSMIGKNPRRTQDKVIFWIGGNDYASYGRSVPTAIDNQRAFWNWLKNMEQYAYSNADLYFIQQTSRYLTETTRATFNPALVSLAAEFSGSIMLPQVPEVMNTNAYQNGTYFVNPVESGSNDSHMLDAGHQKIADMLLANIAA